MYYNRKHYICTCDKQIGLPLHFNQFCNYLYNKADRIGHHLVLFPFQTTDTQIVHGQLDKQLKKSMFHFPFIHQNRKQQSICNCCETHQMCFHHLISNMKQFA